MTVLRSLVFYVVFYLGSLIYTSSSLIVRPFSLGAFRRVVRGWARFQRWCVTALLGVTTVFLDLFHSCLIRWSGCRVP